MLTNTPEGQRFIAFYNAHSDELIELMFSDESLFETAMSALIAIQPLFDDLLTGNGNKAVITQAQVKTIDTLLADIAKAGSRALKQDLAKLKTHWGSLDGYIGKTMSEAQTKALGHGVFLPRLSNP